jgi:hypothetical protein
MKPTDAQRLLYGLGSINRTNITASSPILAARAAKKPRMEEFPRTVDDVSRRRPILKRKILR